MVEDLENRVQRFELVEQLVDFIHSIEYEDLPDAAIESAKIFLMDTIAVGIAGTTYDATDKALAAAKLWGGSNLDKANGGTRVIGRPDVTLSRPSAAFVNGMQVHALEWDGLHEPSVVIAMCVPVSAMIAEIDQHQSDVEASARGTISGKDLILATVIAIEVAVFFGGDTTQGPRFFRPSVAGGMGAAAGLARLRGFDKEQLVNALGLAHAQTAGTMQAHWEGSMALPMQIGNSARMAHMSVDMVEAGMTGPVDFIDGRFGFFRLFESGGDIDMLLNQLGAPYKITEMAHKPYPAGRATQATLTMIRELQKKYDFTAKDVHQMQIFVPPLVMFLVGRPPKEDMTPSYARLCLRFVAPLMLVDGDIDPRRYNEDAFKDAGIADLGYRIDICPDGNRDKNALGPQTMAIQLRDGRSIEANCVDPLGSPGNSLSKQQREDKVRQCFQLGAYINGTDIGDPELYIERCNQLETLDDIGLILDLVSMTFHSSPSS